MDIWKEMNTEYSSSLINNKRIAGRTRLITVFVSVTIISSVFIISQTQDELLAKKSTGNKPGVDGPVDHTHCDQKGYPSCYNVGYSDGQNAPGTSCPSGHSEAYCKGYEAASLSGNSSSNATSSNSSSSSSGGTSSGGTSDLKNTTSPVDQTHCDQKGYPSCYNVGYSDGQNAPGTSCPSGHSEAYCNGYEAASLSGNISSDATSSNSSSSSSSGGSGRSSGGTSDLKNTTSPVDQTHCDQKGYPSCYNVGYSDGQNAPGTSCPSGHSEAYCNGYEAASLSGNSSSDAGTTIRSSPFNSASSIKQNSKVELNQAGQSNSNINVTNSPNINVNSKSSINNNAKEKSNVINEPFLSSPSSAYSGPSSPPSLIQNSKTTINQGAANNANINVNNSSGTRITNEQIIKQSVRINNEVNNLIRNNEVNRIIKENTVSAPQQPLTDLLTVKLS